MASPVSCSCPRPPAPGMEEYRKKLEKTQEQQNGEIEEEGEEEEDVDQDPCAEGSQPG